MTLAGRRWLSSGFISRGADTPGYELNASLAKRGRSRGECLDPGTQVTYSPRQDISLTQQSRGYIPGGVFGRRLRTEDSNEYHTGGQ